MLKARACLTLCLPNPFKPLPRPGLAFSQGKSYKISDHTRFGAIGFRLDVVLAFSRELLSTALNGDGVAVALGCRTTNPNIHLKGIVVNPVRFRDA